MDRGVPVPPNLSHRQIPKRQDTHTPPWERAALTQVPFMRASNPTPLSVAERPDLPHLCTARSHSVSSYDSRTRHQLQQPQRSHSINESSTAEPRTESWSAKQPTPYETQVFLPPMSSRVAPGQAIVSRPLRVPYGPEPPLSPPDSTRGDSVDSAWAAGQCHYGQGVTVQPLPGTMSTRPYTKTTWTAPPSRSDCIDCEIGLDTAPEKSVGRLRSALRAVFRKRPTSQDDCVQIGDKHWTDD